MFYIGGAKTKNAPAVLNCNPIIAIVPKFYFFLNIVMKRKILRNIQVIYLIFARLIYNNIN